MNIGQFCDIIIIILESVRKITVFEDGFLLLCKKATEKYSRLWILAIAQKLSFWYNKFGCCCGFKTFSLMNSAVSKRDSRKISFYNFLQLVFLRSAHWLRLVPAFLWWRVVFLCCALLLFRICLSVPNIRASMELWVSLAG